MEWLLRVSFLFLSTISYGQDSLVIKTIDSIVSGIDADLKLKSQVISDTETVFVDTAAAIEGLRVKWNTVTIETFSNETGEVKKMCYVPQKSDPLCTSPKTIIYFDKGKVIKAIVLDFVRFLPQLEVYHFDSIVYCAGDRIIKALNKKDPLLPIFIENIISRFAEK